MKFKTDQARLELADDPPIPDNLRTKMVRILKGAKSISIQEQTGAKTFKQVNALLLKVDGPRDQPDDPIDTIVEAAAKVMHARWLERNADAETLDAVQFRLQAVCVSGGKARRARPHFLFLWEPDDEDLSTDDLVDYREEIWIELLDRVRAQGDRDMAHIADLQATILEQARMNVEPIAAAGRFSEIASTMMMQSMNLWQSLLQSQFSQESARSEHEEKTKRSEAMYNRLDKYFGFASSVVGDQFAEYLKRKMGGSNVTEEQSRQARRATAKATRTAPQTAQTEESPKTEEEPKDEDEIEDDEEMEHIAIICDMFGSSLTVQQQKKMREVFSTEVMDLFIELFCAETNDEAAEIFLLIKSSATLPQLLELHAMLDATQMELYQGVSKAVAVLTAEEPATDEDEIEPEEPEPEEPDDPDGDDA